MVHFKIRYSMISNFHLRSPASSLARFSARQPLLPLFHSAARPSEVRTSAGAQHRHRKPLRTLEFCLPQVPFTTASSEAAPLGVRYHHSFRPGASLFALRSSESGLLRHRVPGSTVAGGPTTIRQVKLDKECEFRVEVSPDVPLRLRLLTGSAEIYGTEIPPEIWLTFSPRHKFAVFTWYGATIEVDGTAETDYTADETPMMSYVNVHAVLEARRNRAIASPGDSDASQGPRVIVVGPTDSGKSTLSRMLLSWAAKQGWKPTFVDLDIGQGSITIPGCISATPIELPIDPVEGIPLDMPLVYFYGHTTPSVNVDLYKVLVKELAQVLERQFAGNAESRAAGMVINTMGWIESTGYELLLHAIDTFNATTILVLGQEKLCSMLKDVLKNKPNVDVVKLQKSGGVVSRNGKFRQKARSHRIQEYFYGLSNDLSPHSNVANFSDLCIYRIGGAPRAPCSALPIGAELAADPTRLTPVNINRDLLHSVLAVSFAKEPDEIISSNNVAGFIWITNIDFESKKITYLAPSAGIFPRKYLIQGSLIWYGTVEM